MVVQEQQARLAALKDADEEIRKRLGVIRGRFKAEPERGKQHPSGRRSRRLHRVSGLARSPVMPDSGAWRTRRFGR